jgi:hypothetical protein
MNFNRIEPGEVARAKLAFIEAGIVEPDELSEGENYRLCEWHPRAVRGLKQGLRLFEKRLPSGKWKTMEAGTLTPGRVRSAARTESPSTEPARTGPKPRRARKATAPAT